MSVLGVAFGVGVAGDARWAVLGPVYVDERGGAALSEALGVDVALSNFLPEPMLSGSQAIVDNHTANNIETPLACRIDIFLQPLAAVLF